MSMATEAKTKRIVKKTLISYALLTAVTVPFLIPFLWMVSTALKDSAQIMAFPPVWIPNPIMWGNFGEAVTRIPFFMFVKNTVIIVTCSMIGTLVSAPLVAYGFSRIRWPGRDYLLMLVIATMMIPFPVTLIPQFVIFARLGWVNTFYPLIIPSFVGIPFYVFLLRQFFMTIPEDISDSARIDGASELCIYSRIILPLSKPVLAVVSLFQFLTSWNDFLRPLIYLMDPKRYPLSLGLQEFRTTLSEASWMDWNLFMAACTLTVIPTIILFFLAQRHFIEGVHLTGMKE